MYPNPMLNQQMAQLDQEYAQKKANLMQNFYSQQQGSNWNQQSAQQPTPQSAPAQTQNVNWIQVSGLQGAKEHQVPANATHWLMDSTEDAFYVKASDEFGVTKAFKGYRFTEISQQELSGVPESIDMSKYVSKDEFDELKAQLDQFVGVNKKVAAKANKGVEDNG